MIERTFNVPVKVNSTRLVILLAFVIALLLVNVGAASSRVDRCVEKNGTLFQPYGSNTYMCLSTYAIVK